MRVRVSRRPLTIAIAAATMMIASWLTVMLTPATDRRRVEKNGSTNRVSLPNILASDHSSTPEIPRVAMTWLRICSAPILRMMRSIPTPSAPATASATTSEKTSGTPRMAHSS
jgi:hypothetical protein